MIVPAPLRAVTKRSLQSLGSQQWFRPFGMALVRSLNRRTFQRLKSTPGIRDVYVRGSFVRGGFTPLSSDIDLALILTDGGGRSFDMLSHIHKAMRDARRWNPNLRDWWCHMILTSELPVVESFSELYESRNWHDENGRASATHIPRTDERLRAAAAWSQLCLWSGSAFHAFLYPNNRIHSFEAGVKKTFRFAEQMGPGTPSLSCSNRRVALVGVYRAIERGASRILDGIKPGEGGSEGTEFIRTERATFVLLENGLSDPELEKRFSELALQQNPEEAVTYVLPSDAFPAWPFPAEQVLSGRLPRPMPAPLAREVYLFEALFLPSALRLALAFPDARERLCRVVSSLRRAHHLYAGAEPVGTAPPDGDAAALFDEGSSLCEALQEALLSFASARSDRK